MSPRLSGGNRLSTSLSTLKSALTLESTFLSGFTLASALLGTFWRALGPPEPTSPCHKQYTVETLLPGAAAWTFLASLPYKIMNAHASIVAGRLRLTGGHNLATMGELSEV